MALSSAVATLLDANIGEALDTKPGDNLLAIVQKQCIRLGGYRLPPNPSSTMSEVECLPESWPLIFASEESNTLGNVKAAIKSGFPSLQPHIVTQLQHTADSIFRIMKSPKLKLKDAPTGDDLKAQELWIIVEPSILIGRALVNYLKGKIPPKNIPPTPSSPAAVSSTDLSAASIRAMIQSSVAQAMSERGQGGHGQGKRGSGGHEQHGKHQNTHHKRRRY